jgi:hypothetical protein
MVSEGLRSTLLGRTIAVSLSAMPAFLTKQRLILFFGVKESGSTWEHSEGRLETPPRSMMRVRLRVTQPIQTTPCTGSSGKKVC